MRESTTQREANLQNDSAGISDAEPYDEKTFFENYYTAAAHGEITDRDTIGWVSQMESRFHYNAVENAILRALAAGNPPPPRAMVATWEALTLRRSLRLLDVGSGTGHWIDFMRQVCLVSEAVGVEIADNMYEHLQRYYADDSQVRIINTDIAADTFNAGDIGGPVDYVTAIGVLFHIVEDERWTQAISNLAGVLKPGGMLIAGGDFGIQTRDVQFHRTDNFKNWKEQAGEARRVNKRVRSLAHWTTTAHRCRLDVVDLVRAERCELFTTPENDVLLLQRR